MLHEFITANRDDLIARCRGKAALRYPPAIAPPAIDHGVPLFLEQLIETLSREQSTQQRGPAPPVPTPSPTPIGRAAALHGAELLQQGYSVDQVVHEYGDICQAVTDLAVEEGAPIGADEFRTLNRCLDDAIADAVTAYGARRQTVIDDQAETLHGRIDVFADDHRRLVDTAIQTYTAIQTGAIGAGGATGALLIRTLNDLRVLTQRTLPAFRLLSATTTLPSS